MTSDTDSRLKRILHVKKFQPVKEKAFFWEREIIWNYLVNQFPVPTTIDEMLSLAKADGYEFTKTSFKIQLYRLRDERKVSRIKTFGGKVYWLAKALRKRRISLFF